MYRKMLTAAAALAVVAPALLEVTPAEAAVRKQARSAPKYKASKAMVMRQRFNRVTHANGYKPHNANVRPNRPAPAKATWNTNQASKPGSWGGYGGQPSTSHGTAGKEPWNKPSWNTGQSGQSGQSGTWGSKPGTQTGTWG